MRHTKVPPNRQISLTPKRMSSMPPAPTAAWLADRGGRPDTRVLHVRRRARNRHLDPRPRTWRSLSFLPPHWRLCQLARPAAFLSFAPDERLATDAHHVEPRTSRPALSFALRAIRALQVGHVYPLRSQQGAALLSDRPVLKNGANLSDTWLRDGPCACDHTNSIKSSPSEVRMRSPRRVVVQ